MKKIKPKLTTLIFIIIIFLYMSGCSSSKNIGVDITNEKQLANEGFLVRINQEVKIDNEKLLFEKVVFDINSMTFVYKSKVDLPPTAIQIKGIESDETVSALDIVAGNPTPPGSVNYSSNIYNIVTIPHHLKLIGQKATVEININQSRNKFTIDFPGDKIASFAMSQMVNAKGNRVDDPMQAFMSVTVGINFTIVESKSNDDFVVLDSYNKKILQRSIKASSSTQSMAVFDPVKLPRNNLKIICLPVEKTVVISQ